MAKDFRHVISLKLESEAFKGDPADLSPEAQLSVAMLRARQRTGMTQDALSQATGIKQAAISRLENCNSNPSLRTLKRIAAGLGMKLTLDLVPLSPP